MSTSGIPENEQLSMTVQVNPLQSWMIAVKKSFRELKYSPLMQLAGNIFVWTHIGVLVGTGYLLSRLSTVLPSAFGVFFPGAASSSVNTLLERSVRSLQSSVYIWYGMVAVAVLSWILCLPLFSLGKQGVATFILLFVLLLLLLAFKIIATPILLFGVL